jgi:hypothetical protein
MSLHTALPPDKPVYVLGSGASMLALRPEERAYLATQTTVAMNKYLLFWELIGVWPSHFFLADIHYPALRVYEESVGIARAHPEPPHFLLDRTYRRRYGRGPLRRVMNMPFQLKQYRRHGYWYDPGATPPAATYFKRTHGWESPELWGKTLDDRMYFYRGSLSVLLNLLTVLGLGRRIKLLGVDLGTPGSFYDGRLADKPYLADAYLHMQQSGAITTHMTAATFQGMPGIQAQWPFIQRSVESAGFELSCCNPDSLIVQQGLCPHAPVIE